MNDGDGFQMLASRITELSYADAISFLYCTSFSIDIIFSNSGYSRDIKALISPKFPPLVTELSTILNFIILSETTLQYSPFFYFSDILAL